MSSVVVRGREVRLPVAVRAARSWAATYLVPAAPAQRLLPAGLAPARPLPGRAMLTLAFVRYEDTDLGAYDEFAVSFLVRGSGGRGVYIHHLPVNEEFTLAAGRQIWGYPKFAAAIDIVEGAPATCKLSHDGKLVLVLGVRQGVFPMRQPSLPTYSLREGVLCRTPWETTGPAPRARIGGAALVLGPHPMADELRGLGLPRRAILTTTMNPMRARFGAPEPAT